MAHDSEGKGETGGPQPFDLTAGKAASADGSTTVPEARIIRGAFKRMIHSDAMARDLFGFTTLPRSAITYHTMLIALDTGAGLNLVDSTWLVGTQISCHGHQGEDELIIVISGTLEVRIAGSTVRCGAGETAFIPRGVEHEVRALTEVRHIAILTRKSLVGRCPENLLARE